MTVSISLYELPLRLSSRANNATIEEDNKLTVTKAEKLQTLITAAKITDVEPIWTTLFAKVRNTTYEME